MADLLPINNGEVVSKNRLPQLPFDDFRAALLEAARNGYIVHFFAYEEDGELNAIAVMREGNNLYAGRTQLPETFPSLTAENPKFNLFEREIGEQYGARAEGHPWYKMVRYAENWRGKPDVFGNDYKEDIPGRYPYFRVEGEEIHEVGVGPVHAGIIEPGHFRFQCIGERVLHLEISHGYQHRGAERLMVDSGPARRPFIAENISGDTTAAGALCYSHLIEALAGLPVDSKASVVRTIALELERLACHVGDLGALCMDVAFTPPAAFFGRMRGEFLNLLLSLSGNRFGKSLIRPGGIAHQAGQDKFDAMEKKIQELRPQLEHCIDLMLTAHTVLSRFEQCGVVSREAAEFLGMVGPAGRASWMEYDARVTFPTESYHNLPPCPWKRPTGDVLARARIRAVEIMHSLDCLNILLAEAGPTEGIDMTAPAPSLAPDSIVVCLNEAWRGELSHCAVTNSAGEIIRYKVKDPSFHNWNGLAMALQDEEISDFPINNKSFNLSYCGMDL